MRYKTLSSTVRGPAIAADPSPARASRTNLAFIVLVLLIPVVFANVMVTSAVFPVIQLEPTWSYPGGVVLVSGADLPSNARGSLQFDGAATGMPAFKTDKQGSFSVAFGVPAQAGAGSHVVTAVTTERKSGSRARARTAISAILLVAALGSDQPPGLPGASVAPGTGPLPSPTVGALPGSSATPGPRGSSSPAPGGSPSADWQPALPLQAAFYYPWFPEAWDQSGIDPYTNFHPALGRYDGASASVIARHIEAMRWAGLEAGIASWWGQGTRTDAKVPALIAAARGLPFRWSLYHEGESQGDPSVPSIAADLVYIRDHYASDPGYLRIGGRFVVFVYATGSDACAMADRWRAANTVGAFVVLKVFSGYRNCAGQPDGWHQYAPAVARDSQAGYSFAVSPGFWKVGEQPRLARDLARFRADVGAMVASGAPFQLVTTFNEWGEGTAVEGATEWASASGFGSYLDALHDVLVGGSSPVPTAPPTTAPGPTTAPTAPPTTAPGPTTAPSQAPSPGPVTATLVGAGDIASCDSSGDEATAALLAAIPGTVFTSGDNAYVSGSAAEYTSCFDPSWGQFKARTRPVPGNHEYLTAGAAGYFGYFGVAAGDPATGYYAYDLGGWRIYALNSNCSAIGGCGKDSPQELWLRADLAAHPTACVGAIWHHPLFSSGEHGTNTAVRPLWQALQDAGAELVINGHDHDYERFAVQTASGTASPAGLLEYVVGTGGKSHYTFAAPVANSIVRNDSTYGVLKVTLRSNGWDWQFVPVAGGSFTDSGAAVCR